MCDSEVLNTLCCQVCFGFPLFFLSWIFHSILPVLTKSTAVTGPLESLYEDRHSHQANGQHMHWPLGVSAGCVSCVALLELATCSVCNLPSLLDSWDRLQQPCNPERRNNWTENGWRFKCDAPMQGGSSTNTPQMDGRKPKKLPKRLNCLLGVRGFNKMERCK